VTAVGISLLLNPGLVVAITTDLAHSRALLIVTGMAAMLLGLLIVRTHNVWRGWPITVTVFGWLALIGGAIRVLFPDAVAQLSTMVGETHQGLAPFAGGFALLVGLFFTWQGWLVPAEPVPTAFED